MLPETNIDKRAHIFSLCAAIAFAILMLPFNEANDMGFLLNDGRYVVTYGLPHEDPFTMHEGLHFVMHQWLTAVIFWQAYAVGGTYGLFFLVALTGAAVLCLYYKLLVLVSDNKSFSLVMLLVFGPLLSIIFFGVRPQIFSSLILLLAVIALEKHQTTRNNNYLLALPVLSVLLVNMHSALWPMLIVVMLPYLATALAWGRGSNYVIWGERTCLKPLIVTAVVVVAVAFVNPYGYEAVIYGLSSYGIETIKKSVLELQPLTSRLETGKIFLPIFLVMICLCAKHKTKLHYVLFCLGFMYMSLDAIRNLIFFILFGLLPLAHYYWGRRLSPSAEKYEVPEFKPRQIVLFLICLGIIALSLLGNSAHIAADFARNMVPLRQLFLILALVFAALAIYYECRRQTARLDASSNGRTKIFQIGAAVYLLVVLAFVTIGIRTENQISYRGAVPGLNYIATHDPRPNLPLWIDCNIGSYAGFRGFKPFMDTRMEHFFKQNNGKADYFLEMSDLQNGVTYYRDFLAKYKFAYLLTHKGDILDTYLPHDDDYELIYEYDVEPETYVDSANAKEMEKMEKKKDHFRLFRPKQQ